MNAAATQDVRSVDTTPLLQKLLKGSQGAEQAVGADAGRARGLEQARLEPPRQELSTARSTTPGRPSWTPHGRSIADAFMKPQLGQPARRAATRCSRASTRLPARPAQRLVPVLRPRHQEAARHQAAGSVCERLLRRRQPQEVPEVLSGRRSRQPGGRETKSQGTSNPEEVARERDRRADQVRRLGCSRRRCATRTARAGSSR